MAKKAAKKKAAAKKTAAKKKVAAKKKAVAKKKAPAKRATAKKATTKKKSAAKKKAPANKSPVKKTPTKKTTAKKAATKKAATKSKATPKRTEKDYDDAVPLPVRPKANGDHKLTTFEKKQRQRLLDLRDSMVDTMNGVAKDNLRGAGDSGDSSAFGMHQADAGSDAYDRDFALNLLSQEQDALQEIEEALKRLDRGTYGICEMSGKKITHARLEAIPFTRFTVECQAQIEREGGGRGSRRNPNQNFFGMMDDGSGVETQSD